MSVIEQSPISEELPEAGRLLGIDYGTVRMGLAMCDESQRWVTPLDTYHRRNERLDEQFLSQLISKELIRGIVIGLPIHSDGAESQKSREVRDFHLWLARFTDVPCVFQDERFTTAEATRLLREAGLNHEQRKKRVDRLAAHLILDHFLESRRHRSGHLTPLED
ncbi:MAG: Holliday junction resolvase RuvX [Pirellulaceae bacterium]|nr:Holliday junction resolvase RuvX [Pirellulaceae bacterium]